MGAITFSYGSGVADSVFGKSQEPIAMLVESKAEDFEQKAIGPKLFKTVKSKNFAEKLTGMTSMENFLPVGEGGSYPQVGIEEGYSKIVEPDTWKNKFVITQEAVEDNKLLDTSQPLGFITSYERAREDFAAAMMRGAVTATKVTVNGRSYLTTGADGKAYFYAAHPSKVKGESQCNIYKDVFSEDALGKAETLMQNFCDDNGKTLSVAPNTIIIPNDHTTKKAVFAVLNSAKSPVDDSNAFNYMFGRWNVIIWPRLNSLITTVDSTKNVPWLLADLDYNDTYGGAVWLERLALQMKSYIDENTDNNIWKGRARFSAGFNDWRAFVALGVSTASAM